MTPDLIALHQELLALEHEAIWRFETIAARSTSARKRGQASAQAHRKVRDRLREALLLAGTDPVTAQPGYDSAQLNSDDSKSTGAQETLKNLVALYLGLVARTREDERTAFVSDVANASVEIVSWGGQPQPFPGLDS